EHVDAEVQGVAIAHSVLLAQLDEVRPGGDIGVELTGRSGRYRSFAFPCLAIWNPERKVGTEIGGDLGDHPIFTVPLEMALEREATGIDTTISARVGAAVARLLEARIRSAIGARLRRNETTREWIGDQQRE